MKFFMNNEVKDEEELDMRKFESGSQMNTLKEFGWEEIFRDKVWSKTPPKIDSNGDLEEPDSVTMVLV